MKKKNKSQRCHNSNCSITYVPQSKKSRFCCNECRAEFGRERRQRRDKVFNAMIRNLKKWYLTLLRFESGSVVEMSTFQELGLSPAFLPAGRYNKKGMYVYALGEVLLTQVHNDLYEVSHNEEVKGDHSAKLDDTKSNLGSMQEKVDEKKVVLKEETGPVKEIDQEKEALNKIILDQQNEIVKLKTESQFKMSREKLERSLSLLNLMKKPVVDITELLKFEPVMSNWHGTATIDGVVFKKAYMHPTNYRFVHA